MKKPRGVPRRVVLRRVLAYLAVISGAGCMVAGGLAATQAWQLDAHGVRARATVEDVQVLNNSDDCWVVFADGGGAARYEWVEDVPHGVTAGDSLSVVYDRSHPSTIQDLPEMERSRWGNLAESVVLGLLLVGVGLFRLRWGRRYRLDNRSAPAGR